MVWFGLVCLLCDQIDSAENRYIVPDCVCDEVGVIVGGGVSQLFGFGVFVADDPGDNHDKKEYFEGVILIFVVVGVVDMENMRHQNHQE